MSDSLQNCSPCGREGSHVPGIAFCEDCDEHLCVQCLTLHWKIKCLTGHVVRVLGQLYGGRGRGSCQEHPAWRRDHYCSRCDVLCCRECATDRHGQCGAGIVHLQDPLDALATSLGSDRLQEKPSAEQCRAANDELGKLDASIQKLKSGLHGNMSESQEACKKATDAVETLDNLAQQFMKAFLELVGKTADEKRDEDKQTCVERRDEASEIESELSTGLTLYRSQTGKQRAYTFARASQRLTQSFAKGSYEPYVSRVGQGLHTFMEELCRLGDGGLEPLDNCDVSAVAGEELASHVTGMLAVGGRWAVLADAANKNVKLIDSAQGETAIHKLPLPALFQ